MRIVLRVFSSDEHYSANVENAYVFLTESLAKVVSNRLELFDTSLESSQELLTMEFLPELGAVSFYQRLGFYDDENGFLPGEELEKHFEENGWCEIPESNPFKGDLSDSFDDVFQVPVDDVSMVICKAGVYWEGIPRHSNIEITTDIIPREVIARMT
jgi:hypothetical protein